MKILPPDIKEGFTRLDETETDATGKSVLGTMIRNIKVAEDTNNLLCQDTGIPIYNVVIGRGVEVDGHALKRRSPPVAHARRRASAAFLRRAPGHAQERAHVVRAPACRSSTSTSPTRRTRFDRDDPERQRLGKQFVAQNGDPGRRRRSDQDLRHRLRPRRRRQDLPADDRGRGRRRHCRPVRAFAKVAATRAARRRMHRSRGRRAGNGAVGRVNSLALAHRASAATRPRSRCTSKPPRRTSP